MSRPQTGIADWAKEGVNYWENPDCPRDYLEHALSNLIFFVEGVEIPTKALRYHSDELLRQRIAFYEYVADK